MPAYFMTGWYDSLLHETLTVFQGWKRERASEEARRLTRILVGPWSHQIAPWGTVADRARAASSRTSRSARTPSATTSPSTCAGTTRD